MMKDLSGDGRQNLTARVDRSVQREVIDSRVLFWHTV